MQALTSMSCLLTSASPHDGLAKVHAKMMTKNVRHIPVVEEGRLVGILSDRDLLRYAEPDGRSLGFPRGLVAQDVMTKAVVVCRPSTPLAEIATRMIELNIDCMPVTDDAAHLLGIVTSTDLLRIVARQSGRLAGTEIAGEYTYTYAWDAPELSESRAAP